MVHHDVRGFGAVGDGATLSTLATRSSALVVGVDVSAPTRNVVFAACVVATAHRGLSVSAGTGGDIENVLFSDIMVSTRLRGCELVPATVDQDDATGLVVADLGR